MLGFHLANNCRTTIIFGGRWCANSNPILPTEEPRLCPREIGSTVRRGGRGNGAGDPC
ncbi:hypothetical protein ES332_A02G130300v1 [Gossypium tomentosum]|uniref:Uncharacterized protein n=1 Tax=Gossypium tomentosum TaxID=34277 RepID=A0A5D2RKB7_GOSTO|nr:hypothetical protein ES332_A02G130300v1 [Gossypium tomentosum]